MGGGGGILDLFHSSFLLGGGPYRWAELAESAEKYGCATHGIYPTDPWDYLGVDLALGEEKHC